MSALGNPAALNVTLEVGTQKPVAGQTPVVGVLDVQVQSLWGSVKTDTPAAK